MNIYEAINSFVSGNETHITPSQFNDNICQNLNSNDEKKLFYLIRDLLSLYPKENNGDIEFIPMSILDGKRTFAIEDLTESDFISIGNLDLNLLPLNVRARIADILWTQKKSYPSVKTAIQSYYDLAKLNFSTDDWIDSLDYIKRAIFLSAKIKSPLFEDCCSWLLDILYKIGTNKSDYLPLRIISLLLEQKFDDKSIILPILDDIIKNNDDDIAKVSKAYELKLKHPVIRKSQSEIKAINISMANYFVTKANGFVANDFRSAIQAAELLEKAVLIYRNNGEPLKANETHKSMVEVQSHIPALLSSISTPFSISGLHDTIRTNMNGLNPEECIVQLSRMVTFYKKEDMKNQIINEFKKHPISYLFTHNIINESGQTIFKIPGLKNINGDYDPNVLEMHIHKKMLFYENISGSIFLKEAIDYINNSYELLPSHLDFLTQNNPIIPPGRERIFRNALYNALTGDYFGGISILAPQIENLFRNIAKEVGALTVTLEANGTSKEKVLSSIFDLPELTDCYDNDILFLFKGLLNEQCGANIRNIIGHGLSNETLVNSCAGYYFICAVIKLLSFTSIGVYKLIENNPKLEFDFDISLLNFQKN